MTNSAIIEVLTERLGADGVARGADIGRKHYVDFSGEHPCAPKLSEPCLETRV